MGSRPDRKEQQKLIQTARAKIAEECRRMVSEMGEEATPDEKRDILESLLQVPLSLPGTMGRPEPIFRAADFGLEQFVHSFSSDTANPEGLDNAKAIQDSICQILGESLSLADSFHLLQIAKCQYLQERNPIWPWMVLYIYGRASLLPPSWVWEYFLNVASYVGNAVHELRPFKERPVEYSDQAFVKELQLKKAAGKRDHLTEFRKVVTDLRLALRVHSLAFQRTPMKAVGLMGVCRQVADKAWPEKRRPTQADARNSAKQVWKAYHRWFENDGTFLMTPYAREA